MNSLERVEAAIQFKDTDRVPVIAQVFGHAAAIARVPLDRYVSDGEILARCQMQALDRYGYDAVFSVMDTGVEAEAAGSVLEYRADRYPAVKHYALSMDFDPESLILPDPQRDGRMPEMLKALDILRKELKNEVLIVGCVMGPITLATQLVGMERALYMAIDDRDRLETLLDFGTDTAVAFGLAQIQAGAHLPIVFDPAASPAVIPSGLFRQLEVPRLTRIFQSFKEGGAAGAWFHAMGPAAPILSFLPESGADIANFDYYVSAKEAMTILPHTCLDGNIKSLLFLEGTPDRITRQSRDLLDAFGPRGGFILSSGCEIPPEAEPGTVAAMVNAVRPETL